MSRWLPEGVSTYAKDIDFLFYLIYWITMIACAGVLAGLLYIVIRYRAKKGGRAIYSHGNTTLEIIWTIVPTLVFVMIGFMSRAVWSDVRQSSPQPDLTVRITGSQFNWMMTYPGLDGQPGTPDDVSVENLLRVPVNKTIHVVLMSKDVIHSFFLPNMRLKQDAVPGREITVWFNPTKVGNYEIPCAELCGFGHSNMKGALKVLSDEEFNAWVMARKALPSQG